MSSAWTYRADAELPSFAVAWSDRDGNLIDFSSGWTFTVDLVSPSTGAIALTKTTNITGAATSPNVVVAWAAGELDLTPGSYQLHLKARNASTEDRHFNPNSWPVIRIIADPN